MGDRANIYLIDTRDPGRGIYAYTHWSGYEFPELLREALIFGQDRWGDESYLNRIIISRVFLNEHDGTLGAGISTEIGDNEHPIIVVDQRDLTVSFAHPGSEGHRGSWYGTLSFAEYVRQDKAGYPAEDAA